MNICGYNLSEKTEKILKWILFIITSVAIIISIILLTVTPTGSPAFIAGIIIMIVVGLVGSIGFCIKCCREEDGYSEIY